MTLKQLKVRVAKLNLSTAKLPAKVAERFYSSKGWLSLLASIKRERGNRCEVCGRANVRIYGDHVTEIKDGGALLDRSNVMLLCAPCHVTKTNRVRAARKAKNDE